MTRSDGMDLALGLADAISDLAGGGEIGTGVIGTLSALKGLSDTDLKLTPNVHFVTNGHERDSPKTSQYLKGRALKNGGAVAVSVAGGLASVYTAGVNTGGMAKDVNSLGSTGLHLNKLKALLNNKRWERSITVKEWIELTITMKQHKMAIRGTSAVGNANVIVGMPASIMNMFMKAKLKSSYGTIVHKTAMEIHWRAFQEQLMDRQMGSRTGKGAVGPATEIMHEIFTRRGATRIFGRYDIDAMIQEPASWLALADKLNLM